MRLRHWWWRLYLPVEHRIHCLWHHEEHLEKCVCKGTGSLRNIT